MASYRAVIQAVNLKFKRVVVMSGRDLMMLAQSWRVMASRAVICIRMEKTGIIIGFP